MDGTKYAYKLFTKHLCVLTVTNLKMVHNFGVRSDRFNVMGFCTLGDRKCVIVNQIVLRKICCCWLCPYSSISAVSTVWIG